MFHLEQHVLDNQIFSHYSDVVFIALRHAVRVQKTFLLNADILIKNKSIKPYLSYSFCRFPFTGLIEICNYLLSNIQPGRFVNKRVRETDIIATSNLCVNIKYNRLKDIYYSICHGNRPGRSQKKWFQLKYLMTILCFSKNMPELTTTNTRQCNQTYRIC